MTLHATSVHAGYPVCATVLQDLDLKVPRGRMLALVGCNGSGKSTLLRVLAGLHAPSSGQVFLEDKPLHELSPANRAQRIGYLPQEILPQFAWQVDETVALGARVAGHGRWFDASLRADARQAIAAALDAVNARDLEHRALAELSGGERRRVLMASVLAQEPDWLLLDEPGAMLDLPHHAALLRLLRGLAEDNTDRPGLGILVATHDLNLAAAHAHELLLLDQGNIVLQGSPAEVFASPKLDDAMGGKFLRIPRDGGPPVLLPA